MPAFESAFGFGFDPFLLVGGFGEQLRIPRPFEQHAQTLANSMAALEKASRTHDIKTVYRVSANLDEDCDGCHKPFWGTDDPPPPPKSGVPVIRGR